MGYFDDHFKEIRGGSRGGSSGRGRCRSGRGFLELEENLKREKRRSRTACHMETGSVPRLLEW
jgi:hypothetical protein